MKLDTATYAAGFIEDTSTVCDRHGHQWIHVGDKYYHQATGHPLQPYVRQYFHKFVCPECGKEKRVEF